MYTLYGTFKSFRMASFDYQTSFDVTDKRLIEWNIENKWCLDMIKQPHLNGLFHLFDNAHYRVMNVPVLYQSSEIGV